MDFLKTCSTNAHAIGDFDAIAYQAFSVTRNTSQPPAHPADASPLDDVRAAEAQLRHGRHLVTPDASRPWLWHFSPIAVDMVGQDAVELPALDGYTLRREQVGFMKASEMARPPLRPGNPHAHVNPATTPSNAAAQTSVQGTNTRSAPGATDQPQSLDCFTVYELFASSITALICFFLVKHCGAVALNYRTLVSKSISVQGTGHDDDDGSATLYWLTGIHVHWFSSGTLLVSTSTEQTKTLRCLGDMCEDEQKRFIGRCIRVAPNAMLACIWSFAHRPDPSADDGNPWNQKKTKPDPLDEGIEKWKSAVARWLSWRGFSIPNLDKKSAWVTLRLEQLAQFPAMGPLVPGSFRDVIWPCALCFVPYSTNVSTFTARDPDGFSSPAFQDDLRWFETPDDAGFRDPIDVAQDWYMGKLERDKILDVQRKPRKTEEDATRRKDELHGFYASSPFNARIGVYGDLQAVSGVYPTPPDGIAPGTGLSSTDTPSVSGTTSKVVLVPGSSHPAINLSASRDHHATDDQQQLSTSPTFSAVREPFQPSREDDDLFEDMEEDEYTGAGIAEADFDFFDGPNNVDVDMTEAPALPQTDAKPRMQHNHDDTEAVGGEEASVKEDMHDPLRALENALVATYQPSKDEAHESKPSKKGAQDLVTAEASSEVSHVQEIGYQKNGDQTAFRESTPPLSPSAIAKTLQPSPPTKAFSNPVSIQQDNSAFHALDFSRRLSLVDAKYHDGRFAIQPEEDEEDDATMILSRINSLKDLSTPNKIRYTVAVPSPSKSSKLLSLAQDVSDGSASECDSEASNASEVDLEDTAELHPAAFPVRFIIPAKRKLPTEGHETPMSATSFAESLAGDRQDSGSLLLDERALTIFEPDSWDWAIVHLPPPIELPAQGSRYVTPLMPLSTTQLPKTQGFPPDADIESPEEKPVGGKESIVIVQIVTDQVASATLDLLEEDNPLHATSYTHPSTENRWQTALRQLFPKALECNLPALVAINDVFPDLSVPAKGQQRPPPRKQKESNAIPSNHIYQINPPYIRFRRAETCWDLLPPAVAFWELLGLAPVSPPKNVVVCSVYPHSVSLRPILDDFLLNLQLAYDACKLGLHARVESIAEYEDGLVPVKVDTQTSPKEVFKALKDTCVHLGKLLASNHSQIQEQQETKIDAFVVYMIDPFNNPAALWELCSAFWALFQAYGQGPSGRLASSHKPDLVLQIIPIKYVASWDVPVILDAATFASLAREVYDRCPPSATSTDKTPLSIYKAPAFQLEETLPRNVQFKLVPEPPQDLLRENSYMHIAYAVSLDGNWLTAAWSDSCGKSQAIVSYHLGTRAFGEIAKEIWQTTIEILEGRRVQWRVCIAKSGPLDREELETWVLLITCPTQVNLFLTLLTVIEDPPYKFTPTTDTSSSSNSQATANTPVSTPQAGVSPDPLIGSTPATTPSADSISEPATDPEARLFDVTDETWGIILAHRLHNSNSTNQFCPALISGLLVKRGITYATSNSTYRPIPDPLHGPVTVAVNILWIGAVGSTRAATSPFPPDSPGGSAPPSPAERSTSSLMWTPTVQTRSTAENLLKELLTQFRALGLLAKLRGMRGTMHGTIPWHVVAAKRGVEGLSRACRMTV